MLFIAPLLFSALTFSDPNYSATSKFGEVHVWVTTKFGNMVVQAKNNTWICPESWIDIYAEKPSVLTIVINNETKVKAQPFRFHQTVNLHLNGKDGAPVKIVVIINDRKITFNFKLKTKGVPGLGEMITMAQRELQELIRKITLEVLVKTFIAASIGIGLAYIVKSRMLLESALNPFNFIFALVGGLLIYAAYQYGLNDKYAYFYVVPLFIAQMYSYRLFSVGEYMHIVHVDAKNRVINEDEVLTYKTSDGKRAIALQDWREALKRLLGYHVYISPQNVPASWSFNGDNCVVVQSAEIKRIRDLTEVEKALQEYEEKEKKRIPSELKKKVMDWLAEKWQVTYRVLHLDLVDAHKVSVLDWMIYANTMNRLTSAYEELYRKYLKLRLQLRALIMHKKGRMVEDVISSFDEFLNAHRVRIEQTLQETRLQHDLNKTPRLYEVRP